MHVHIKQVITESLVTTRHRQTVRRGQTPCGPGGAPATDFVRVVRAGRGGRRTHAHAQ